MKNNIAIGHEAGSHLEGLSKTICFGDDVSPTQDGELVVGKTFMGAPIPNGVQDLLRSADVDSVRWLFRALLAIRSTDEMQLFIACCDERGLFAGEMT